MRHVFTAEDERNPAYCMRCKRPAPRAELEELQGFCAECIEEMEQLREIAARRRAEKEPTDSTRTDAGGQATADRTGS